MSSVRAANMVSSERVVPRPAGDNWSVNLRVVPAISKLSDGAKVASGGRGLWGMDCTGNLDAVPHKAITLMPLSLLLKLLPILGLTGGVLALVEGGGPYSFLYGVAGSGTLLSLIGAVKWFIERRDKARSEALALGRTDAQIDLDRAKLLDAQQVMLLKQVEEFYGFRDKEKQAVIDLQKATIQQRDDHIMQLQCLVSQQAATIQQLKGA